jgi:hypothetical protein
MGRLEDRIEWLEKEVRTLIFDKKMAKLNVEYHKLKTRLVPLGLKISVVDQVIDHGPNEYPINYYTISSSDGTVLSQTRYHETLVFIRGLEACKHVEKPTQRETKKPIQRDKKTER